MSMAALLQGIKSHLATDLLLPAPVIGIQAKGTEGRPPAAAGALYYCIHPVRWYAGPSHGRQNVGSDEMYDVAITISMKTGRIPESKLTDVSYLDLAVGASLDIRGLEAKMRAVIVSMTTGRYTGVLASANSYIGIDADPFIEPLYLSSVDADPIQVGPEWFSADADNIQAAGFRMTAHFVGARRLQHLSTME